MTRLGIVGGGITGLTVAYRAVQAGHEVTLWEADERLGGKLHTAELAGHPHDVGADAFLARQPHAERLARELGLGAELVEPAASKVWLWVDGGLRPLPEATFFGIPTSARALARAGVVSRRSVVRTALEPLRPGTGVTGPVSVAEVVERRLGAEIVDRLVEPLLGGVYAGRADQLDAAATIPPLAALAESGGSLTKGLATVRRAATGSGPVFRTVTGGLTRLIGALHEALPADTVRLGAPVDALRPTGAGWVVSADGDTEVDEVALTVPAHVGARLLTDVAPTLAEELSGIPYASVAVVSLAYPAASADRLPEGSGMLVPRSEGRLVKAVTWSSRKWPHVPADPFVLRASVGRIDDDRALTLDHDQLVATVVDELATALGLTEQPVDVRVTRWPDALPQYAVGHLARLRRIRDAAVTEAAGLHLAGAAYSGVGIAHCVRQAEELVAGLGQ